MLASKAATTSASAASARRHQPRAAPAPRQQRPSAAAAAFKVTLEHEGKPTVLEVEDGTTILEAALDAGLDLPHDCTMGVCMRCPARLVKGEVDQGVGMLSEDVVARGYTLLCTATPLSDVEIRTIGEDELLDQQLVAGNQ
jgi:ferredoxin